MHWSPDPEVMYNKAHRGPKLSLLFINWPIFVQYMYKPGAKYAQNL